MSLKLIIRWIPLLLLLLALICFFYFKLYLYINFETLKQHHKLLSQWTNQHYGLSVLLYMLIYILTIAISIPGATLLTLIGGFLFGIIPGTIYVVISATLGATILFLSIKTTIGNWLARKAKGWITKMEHGFKQNAFNYLLALRLVPLFPFWIVNIVPALINIRLITFISATFFGIIPGSFIYVSAGSGLNILFATNTLPDLSVILKPQIFLPLIGLAILALIPVAYRYLRACSKSR